MLKKMLVAVAVSFATLSGAFAAVDVNTADQATLESVRGIGPSRATAIIDARTKGGAFKNGADLAERVTGIGPKSVAKLEEEGLVFGSKAATAPAAKKTASAPAKAKADGKK